MDRAFDQPQVKLSLLRSISLKIIPLRTVKNTFTLLYLCMHTGVFLRIFTYRDICMNVNFTIFLRKCMDKWHKSYTLLKAVLCGIQLCI
jgi:hypothetical protein